MQSHKQNTSKNNPKMRTQILQADYSMGQWGTMCYISIVGHDILFVFWETQQTVIDNTSKQLLNQTVT